jgi:hypothetical protein
MGRKPQAPEKRVAVPDKKELRGTSGWDAAHPPKSYRDIPDEFHDELKEIAEDMDLSVGAVLYFFAQYGKEAYEQGKLTIPTRPRVRRMELDSQPETRP